MGTATWPHAVLGREQLPVRVGPTVCNGSECMQRGRARLEDGKRPKDDKDDKLFTERAKEIRDICMKERAGNCKHRKLYHDQPQCALPQQTGSQWQGWMPGWQYLALTVDSGAAENIIPHMLVQDQATQETDASRNGLNYASATGDPIPNLGEQKLPLLTHEGSLRAVTFQAAPVDRALGSVKRMCSSGHMVVFGDDGSYVLNMMTGEVNWMREESGNCIIDLWVMQIKARVLRGNASDKER